MILFYWLETRSLKKYKRKSKKRQKGPDAWQLRAREGADIAEERAVEVISPLLAQHSMASAHIHVLGKV